MASLNLAPEELKQLEMVRNRLLQLTHTLVSVRTNVGNSQPLPSRESLQAQATILQQNVKSIQDIANENSQLFQRVALHPSTNFPGRTQEHVLLSLLRKKLDPEVERCVEEARDAAKAAGVDPSKLDIGRGPGGGRGYGNYGDEDDVDFDFDPEADAPSDPLNTQWADIDNTSKDIGSQYLRNQLSQPYTVAEQQMGIQNVRTGLRRILRKENIGYESDEDDEDEDDDEDDEDEEMADAGAKDGTGRAGGLAGGPGAAPKREPEQILWFAARGDTSLPPNVELEWQRKQREAKAKGMGGM